MSGEKAAAPFGAEPAAVLDLAADIAGGIALPEPAITTAARAAAPLLVALPAAQLRHTIEKVAHQLAAKYAEMHLPQLPHLPELPSVAELRRRAEEMYAASPSMDDIAARARELIAQRMATLRAPEQAPA